MTRTKTQPLTLDEAQAAYDELRRRAVDNGDVTAAELTAAQADVDLARLNAEADATREAEKQQATHAAAVTSVQDALAEAHATGLPKLRDRYADTVTALTALHQELEAYRAARNDLSRRAHALGAGDITDAMLAPRGIDDYATFAAHEASGRDLGTVHELHTDKAKAAILRKVEAQQAAARRPLVPITLLRPVGDAAAGDVIEVDDNAVEWFTDNGYVAST